MRKLISLIVICTILITNLAQMCFAQEFYCRWRSGYMYKTQEVVYGQSAYEFCDAFRDNEILFSTCVTQDYPESVKALREGNCREIISKEYKIGESTCTVKSLKPDNEFYKKSCEGPDKDSALIELDKMINKKR